MLTLIFTSFMYSVATKITKSISHLHSLIIRILLLLFLFLPTRYYAAHFDELYADDEGRYLEDFEEWTRQALLLPVDPSTRASGTNTASNSFPMLALQRPPFMPSSESTDPLCSTASRHSPLPDSITKLHEVWNTYIQTCAGEWGKLVKLAVCMLGVDLAILQVLSSTDDPQTRALAFFALSRSFFALLYATGLASYFERSHTRSAQFAVLWTRETRVPAGGLRCRLWIMLSLPASSVIWATIFSIMSLWSLALLYFRPGVRVPLPEAVAVAVFSLFSADISLSIIAFLWALSWMAWLNRELHTIQCRQVA